MVAEQVQNAQQPYFDAREGLRFFECILFPEIIVLDLTNLPKNDRARLVS